MKRTNYTFAKSEYSICHRCDREVHYSDFEGEFCSSCADEEEIIFNQGDLVNVTRKENDLFNHDFTGHVTSKNGGSMIFVEDQDGDVWACDLDQVKHSSDDIMHGNS